MVVIVGVLCFGRNLFTLLTLVWTVIKRNNFKYLIKIEKLWLKFKNYFKNLIFPLLIF